MSKKEKTTSWSWKITSEELKEQVENYNTLKITQSYRGVSVLIVGALLLFSLLLSFFGVYADVTSMIYGMLIYVPILFFVYRGHRWAIILLMILWTYEKGYTLFLSVQSGGGGIGSVIWWLIVTPYIYNALVVENAHRKIARVAIKADTIFCSKCGTKQVTDAKFCTECGAGLIVPNN